MTKLQHEITQRELFLLLEIICHGGSFRYTCEWNTSIYRAFVHVQRHAQVHMRSVHVIQNFREKPEKGV